MLSTLGESVQNFVAAMSDVHTYWEHRIKDLKAGFKLTDQSSELSKLLLQNVKFLRPIEQSFQVFILNVFLRTWAEIMSNLQYLSIINYWLVDIVCEDILVDFIETILDGIWQIIQN